MLLISALFWDITQRRVVILYPRWGTTYRSRLQGPRSPSSWPFLLDYLTLEKMGPIRCPETSAKDYHSTLRNIPEERRSRPVSPFFLSWTPTIYRHAVGIRMLAYLTNCSILCPHLEFKRRCQEQNQHHLMFSLPFDTVISRGLVHRNCVMAFQVSKTSQTPVNTSVKQLSLMKHFPVYIHVLKMFGTWLRTMPMPFGIPCIECPETPLVVWNCHHLREKQRAVFSQWHWLRMKSSEMQNCVTGRVFPGISNYR